MPYIPDNLYIEQKNQEKVAELFEKYFASDVVDNPNLEDDFFAELEKLGETQVYEYLKITEW